MNYRKSALFSLFLATFITLPTLTEAATARVVSSPFLYNFNSTGVLEESWPMDNSSSPYFWLNSGAKLIIADGVGKTVQGPLKAGEKWQLAYAKSNPLDTAGGYYPQNLFRLITRSTWNNLSEEVKFKITNTNLTATPNRDGYSGILFLSRYKDENNLYYAGIRMDGLAVVKKKINGIYHTLGTAQVFGVAKSFDKTTNPNLIPVNQWMKLKSETKDLSTGEVSITLWLDKNDTGEWTQILSVTDKPGIYGGSAVLKGAAYAGIRTDYMDVLFEDYKLTEL